MKTKLTTIVRHITRKEFLLFAAFFLRFYGRPRNIRKKHISFLGYTIDIPDGPSFLWQFKDIFVDEALKFTATTESPVVYDCGSNIGMSVLYVKKLHPHARITAFEADEEIARISERNLRTNTITDVTIIPKAVWKDSDGVPFVCDGADGGSVHGEGVAHMVSSVRLKEYLEAEDHVDFLKMDIEGAEVVVLSDCRDQLHKVQNIFIEYHSWNTSAQELSKILAMLEKEGFRYYMSTINKRSHPLMYTRDSHGMDLQINIYGKRE